MSAYRTAACAKRSPWRFRSWRTLRELMGAGRSRSSSPCTAMTSGQGAFSLSPVSPLDCEDHHDANRVEASTDAAVGDADCGVWQGGKHLGQPLAHALVSRG